MKHARRPPLHPNCRSTLIPVVDLVDPETGEKIEETAERPAQNADGSYSQVAAKTTFKDYFESQPETFQREWLGEKRFELWKSGKLKFEDLAKPATSYRATPADLTPPTEKPKETAASDDKTDKTPATPPANEPLAPWEGPDELARLREKKRVDPATLPTLDGSPKQIAWVRDRIRADQVDAFNAVDLPEYLKTRIGGATDDEEEARRLALVRAEIEKRGEAAVLAELEEAAQEIAAKMFEETSCRVWIDGRFGPGVLHRSTTEALRRVATTGSAKPPKPAFDLPPLDLPELKLSRLSGTPRQVSWAEDLRRRAVRDLTEERANETARDNVQAWRRWSSRRDAKNIREALPELEKAIAEVGGDDAAARILGREAFLKAREYVEAWDDSRDWIDLKTEQKVDLNAYAAQKIAGTPKEAAAILRRYAADAKAQQSDEEFDLAASSEGFAQRFKRLAGFSSSSKAATEAREKLKIDADYSKIPRDVAEEMNKELEKALERFGSFGFVEKIEALDRTNALGSYDGKKGIIYLRPDLNLDGLFGDMEISFEKDANAYSTASRRHPLRHEIGHAIMQAVKNKHFNKTGRRSEIEAQWEEREENLKKLCREVLENPALASTRAMQDQFEIVAEAFAVALLDDFERKVIFKGREKELAVKDAFAAKVMLTLIGVL